MGGSVSISAKDWSVDDVELVLQPKHHVIYLTMAGGSRRTSFRTADGQHYEGRDGPGDVSIIPSGCERHATFFGARLRFACLRFESAMMPMSGLGVSNGTRSFRSVSNCKDPLVQHLVGALLEEAADETLGGTLFVESVVTALGFHLLRRYGCVSPQTAFGSGRLSERRRRDVEAYIDANLSQDLRLSQLSEIAGLSVSHFARLFRAEVGVAPYQYVLERRTERAKDLLARGKLSLVEIALVCGFANQAHFTKVFTRLVGVSPGAFRHSTSS